MDRDEAINVERGRGRGEGTLLPPPSLSLSSTRCIASLFFRCIERTSSLFDRMQSSLERGIEGRVVERRTFDLVNSFSNGAEEDDTRVSVPLSFSLSLPVLSSFSSFLSLFFRFFLLPFLLSLLSPVSPVSTGDGCRVRIDDAWKSRFGRVSINRLRDE